MENMGMIRQIAWSFNKTTGLDIDELISEASLAYAIWLPKYDASKAKITTYMYPRIRCHLISYCNKQIIPEDNCDPADLDNNISQKSSQEERTAFKQMLENSSDEVKFLTDMIFKAPAEFIGTASRTNVRDKLRESGWTWSMIWRSFAEIKDLLKEPA